MGAHRLEILYLQDSSALPKLLELQQMYIQWRDPHCLFLSTIRPHRTMDTAGSTGNNSQRVRLEEAVLSLVSGDDLAAAATATTSNLEKEMQGHLPAPSRSPRPARVR